jgi:hypothetical protein
VSSKRKRAFTSVDSRSTITSSVAAATTQTNVIFSPSPSTLRSFDFKQWYVPEIQALTVAIRGVIQQMLDSGNYSTSTVISHCYNGAKFLTFCQNRAVQRQSIMTLDDIDLSLIEDFIVWISQLPNQKGEGFLNFSSQKGIYKSAKAILLQLSSLGLLPSPEHILPPAAYRGVPKTEQRATSLSKSERRDVAAALRIELDAILDDTFNGTQGLAWGLLAAIIAMRTGMNATPLVELSRDALRPHPLKASDRLLVSYKRRNGTTQLARLSWSAGYEKSLTAKSDVIAIYEWVRDRTESMIADAPAHLRSRLWLYRYAGYIKTRHGDVTALSLAAIANALQELVTRHDLRSDEGQPLTLNIARLRKTFVNRIYELTRDPLLTARLANHTPKVSNDHYLEASAEQRHDFKYAGQILYDTLTTTDDTPLRQNTPVAGCTDPIDGQYAPKDGTYCDRFLHCFKCKNMVVTQDDLWRLYSFYWLLNKERHIIAADHWARLYGTVINLIDEAIAGHFPDDVVRQAKNRAQDSPHPFWWDRSYLLAEVGK